MIERKGREYLIDTINKSYSISEVLRTYGLCDSGSASRTALRKMIKEWDISIALNKEKDKTRTLSRTKLKLEDIFCENSKVSQHALKRKIKLEKLIAFETCSICGIGDTWNNKPIVFILDHINGIRNHNTIENLRFICPNCNSQLETTGSRNKNRIGRIYFPEPLFETCEKCKEKKKPTKNILCIKCSRIKSRKFNPSKEELSKLYKEMPMVAIAKLFGVSDKAVSKRLKLLEIK